MSLTAPTRSYVAPAGVDAAALVAALAERLDVAADQPTTGEATVLDTADRRLRDAGLELRLGTGRSAGRLTLRDHPGAPPLAAEVPPEATRFLAPDLPAGPLRDRLAPVIEERALLPLVRLRVELRPLRVLDDEGKTVVRVAVATSTALGLPPSVPDTPPLAAMGPLDEPEPSDGPVDLRPELDVAGVLGYPKPLTRLTTLLADDLALSESNAGLADEAVAALGGDPRGLRSKVEVHLHPAERADEAAVTVLTELAGMVEANLPGALADLDTEFVHDLRVAVRRSRSVLREMKATFPPEPLARHREGLKWIQTVTGDVRDLDVQLLDWDGLAERVAPDRRAAMAPVRTLLAERRAAALTQLRRDLGSDRFNDVWVGYRLFLAGDLGPEDDRPAAATPIGKVAGRRIRKVYDRMLAMGGAIDDASPPEALHELRKRGKELRYLLELFGVLWPADVVKPMVKTLKRLQDVLGLHQDRAVQIAHLGSLAPDLAVVPDGPDALLSLGALIDRLAAEQHEARADFAERFAAFAAKDQQRLVHRTFRMPA